jgi:hypothetical protein
MSSVVPFEEVYNRIYIIIWFHIDGLLIYIYMHVHTLTPLTVEKHVIFTVMHPHVKVKTETLGSCQSIIIDNYILHHSFWLELYHILSCLYLK